MANDEIFSGPMSESVPTASSSFAHRRPRADSTASFTYYDDEDEERDAESDEEWLQEEAIIDEDPEMESQEGVEDGHAFAEPEMDLEANERPSLHSRKSSGYSRSSARSPLLRRRRSSDTDRSTRSGYGAGGRMSQKIYIQNEDMTIVVAGFKTSVVGYAIYLCISICTLGLGYLLFRWLPRWQVRLTGSPTPLHKCDWLVIENQWNEMVVQQLNKQNFDMPLSSVFGLPGKGKMREFDDYNDPILDELRIMDYRYIRFCFHPFKDKFVLGNTWQDPAWTDVVTIRAGIDGEAKENRERIFG